MRGRRLTWTARETHKNVNQRPYVLIFAERAEAPVPPLCGDSSATVEPTGGFLAAAQGLSHAISRPLPYGSRTRIAANSRPIVGSIRGNDRPKRAGGNSGRRLGALRARDRHRASKRSNRDVQRLCPLVAARRT